MPTFRTVAVPPSQRDASWRDQLRQDSLVLEAWHRGGATLDALAAAAARLVDSRHRPEIAAALERLPPQQIEEHAGLAYAAGCLSLAAGDNDAALRWFAQAQAALDPSWRRLASRIAFEQGFVHLAGSRAVTADTMLAWAEGMYPEGATANADLLHLRALAAETMGDHVGARALYRAALERSTESLTPMTRALVMANLAVSMNHVDPEESLALIGFAGALLETEELDPRLRPALSNIEAYALLCLGRLHDARAAASRAGEEARATRYRRVELYALFNTAIIDELEGDLRSARARLELVRRESAAGGLGDLEGWTAVRLAWLQVRGGDAVAARALLEEADALLAPMRYSESLQILSGLIRFAQGRLASARLDLESALRSAGQRGDLFTELALLLWLGLLEHRVGRDRAAERVTARALDLARSHGLRLSPNWWSSEIVRAAQAGGSDATTAGRLIAPPEDPPGAWRPDKVQVFRDGRVFLGGEALAPGAWRIGRTGSRVLRRFFGKLVSVYPSAVPRDELAEYLWPESDGDRAVRNLYSATVDLRRLLAELPGLAVATEDGAYALRCEANAEFREEAQQMLSAP